VLPAPRMRGPRLGQILSLRQFWTELVDSQFEEDGSRVAAPVGRRRRRPRRSWAGFRASRNARNAADVVGAGGCITSMIRSTRGVAHEPRPSQLRVAPPGKARFQANSAVSPRASHQRSSPAPGGRTSTLTPAGRSCAAGTLPLSAHALPAACRGQSHPSRACTSLRRSTSFVHGSPLGLPMGDFELAFIPSTSGMSLRDEQESKGSHPRCSARG
jgi:hypothetical protein